MRYVLAAAPDAPVVTTAEARAQGIGASDDADDLVDALVAAAAGHLDGRAGILGRALVNQTWRLDVASPDACGRIAIDMPNVGSVSSVKYLVDGDEATWSTTEWRLGSVGNFYFVAPKTGYSWPSADDQEDAFRVTFVTGYGDAGSDVPAAIRQATILLARHLYNVVENNLFLARDEVPGVLTQQFVVSEASGNVIQAAIDALVAPYRVRSL